MSRPGSPSSPLRLTGSPFSSPGLTYDDHHIKSKDGTYEASPPETLRSLYSQEGPPPKLNLGSAINALKAQNHCAGVYVLQKQPGKPEGEANKQPLYKHCSEDLQICAGTVKGEPGWVVWGPKGPRHREDS